MSRINKEVRRWFSTLLSSDNEILMVFEKGFNETLKKNKHLKITSSIVAKVTCQTLVIYHKYCTIL